MLNTTDRFGSTKVEKFLFQPGSVSKSVIENPFMELLYKSNKFDVAFANKLTAYYSNIYNKYDLEVSFKLKKLLELSSLQSDKPNGLCESNLL